MKIPVINKEGEKVSDVDFNLLGTVREDIYKRAVLAESSLMYQEKGADPKAGKKYAIHLSKRRKTLRTTYGRGGSRTPKKVMWSRGTQFRFVGAFAAQTVGGRKAHAPKADKNILKFINNKEWLKALQTGVVASFDKKIVEANGQKVPEQYPVVLDKSVQDLTKTKDAKELFEKLGFTDEIERVAVRKIRAGKGTKRGRTYKQKRGPLVVISSFEEPLFKSARNIRGVDVMPIEVLMASDFGMSEKPGRAVIFTKEALEEFKEALN